MESIEVKETKVALSPPWYIFANEIKYTYGVSDLVKVNDLIEVDEQYLLVINVYDDKVAEALRRVIPVTKVFGNVTVNVTIFNSKGREVEVTNIEYTPETLAKLYCTALKCNPLFGGAVVVDGKVPDQLISTIGDVVIVIARVIIQFYNDDISELCGNFNEVAAKVFAEVSVTEFTPNLKVGFSTYDRCCKLQKQTFC